MEEAVKEVEPLPGGFIRQDDDPPSPSTSTTPGRNAKRPSEDTDGDLGLVNPAKRPRKSAEAEEDVDVPDTPPRQVAPLPDAPVEPPRDRSPPMLNGVRPAAKSPASNSPRLGSPPTVKAGSPNSSPQSNSSTSSLESLGGTGQRRVKVYRLQGEQWDDLGTGWCHIWTEVPPGEKVDEDDGPWIVVRSEEGPETTEGPQPAVEQSKAETLWTSGMRSVIMLGASDAERGGYQKQQSASAPFPIWLSS